LPDVPSNLLQRVVLEQWPVKVARRTIPVHGDVGSIFGAPVCVTSTWACSAFGVLAADGTPGPVFEDPSHFPLVFTLDDEGPVLSTADPLRARRRGG
jgi:hypothetical protein